MTCSVFRNTVARIAGNRHSSGRSDRHAGQDCLTGSPTGSDAAAIAPACLERSFGILMGDDQLLDQILKLDGLQAIVGSAMFQSLHARLQ